MWLAHRIESTDTYRLMATRWLEQNVFKAGLSRSWYAFKNARKNQSAPVFPYVGSASGHQELRTCAAIINVFHLIPAASQKMIEPLTSLMLKGERELLIEVGVRSRRRLFRSSLARGVYCGGLLALTGCEIVWNKIQANSRCSVFWCP